MSPDRLRSAASRQARPGTEPGTGPGLPSGRVRPGPRPGLLVLGPLVLRGASGPVKLGGVKPRRLLAALALNAGRVISADRLIDIAWGEQPPRTARQNLHTYLWSLRRSLAAAAGPRLVIQERPPGYLLRAAPGDLDWHRFRDLCSAARRCPSSDPVAGATLLRQALGLWRGPALFDVADGLPQLAARLAAMEEERLTALEQRIRADLAAGRHDELTAELAELAAAHPFREQFLAHQMVALYRCGRQAEALTGFHLLRERLADELGVDPSPELSRLYVAMLRGDAALDRPSAPGPLAAGLAGYSAESKLTEL